MGSKGGSLKFLMQKLHWGRRQGTDFHCGVRGGRVEGRREYIYLHERMYILPTKSLPCPVRQLPLAS